MDFIQLINSVGFPIFACFYLASNNRELTNSISSLNTTLAGINTRLELIERKQCIYEENIN